MTGIFEIWKNHKKIADIEDYNLDFKILNKILLEFFFNAEHGDIIEIRCELPT